MDVNLLKEFGIPIATGVAAGVIVLWVGYKYITRPKPSLRIVDYMARQITVPRRSDKEIVLDHGIHPRIHNDGDKATTILSIKVDIGNGKWVRLYDMYKSPYYKKERDIGPGSTQLFQLSSILTKEGCFVAPSLDFFPKKIHCRLIIKHTGSKKPLVDRFYLNREEIGA